MITKPEKVPAPIADDRILRDLKPSERIRVILWLRALRDKAPRDEADCIRIANSFRLRGGLR